VEFRSFAALPPPADARIDPPGSLTWRSGNQVYVPSLEELLLACGEQFDCMERREGGEWLA
jgi:hypothetical protein